MNPFILSPEDRLDHWKKFRSSLVDLSEEDKLTRVAEYWALAPLSKLAYDIERPDNWPTPWEMITNGDWCRNSVAIGMEFTLRLSGFPAERMELTLIRDWDISEVILVLNIDQKTVLNYTYDSVDLYPTTRHDVVGRWQFCGKLYRAVP